MAQLALAAFCLVAFAATSSALTPMEFGMDTACNAHKAACWYEYLKQFPKTDAKAGGLCLITCDFQKESAKKYDGDRGKNAFISGVSGQPMESLPSEYASNCNADLKSASADSSTDESDALNDGKQKYPFRAFAYCLMKTLRSRNGAKAIEAVKSERTHYTQDWRQTLLDRDNEFRARHGANPLVRIAELETPAQEWAEKNAAMCSSDHSQREQRYLSGNQTGESLSAGGGPDVPADAAYLASDGWYEEINHPYPFPAGIKGGRGDPTFPHVGHFTQTVWKETQYVGYGYAYNPNCPAYKFYIAARYYPAGNMPGDFQKNVLPPQ
ncbi:unnamed protein product [Orchesella dallaii]|uniref:SCP domain-containing protein n=1 Tax=Orchesella dallaii TaxID=48710 RepID=A0ABP1R6M0_9HEXA